MSGGARGEFTNEAEHWEGQTQGSAASPLWRANHKAAPWRSAGLQINALASRFSAVPSIAEIRETKRLAPLGRAAVS
jgi:hypothetical protein